MAESTPKTSRITTSGTKRRHFESASTDPTTPPSSSRTPTNPPLPKRTRYTTPATSSTPTIKTAVSYNHDPAKETMDMTAPMPRSGPEGERGGLDYGRFWTFSEKTELINSYQHEVYVEEMVNELFSIFWRVAQSVKGDGKIGCGGPSILWQLFPSFVNWISTTPWGYFEEEVVRGKDAIGEDDCISLFIFPFYGDKGMTLSAKQKKFRMVLLTKVREEFQLFLCTRFSTNLFRLVYPSSFFEDSCASN